MTTDLPWWYPQHKDSDADSDGDFSDVEWFDDDDDLVVCPLDDRDAFIDFTDSLRTMQQAMPGRFQALTGRTELQEALREATMYADKRRAEIAAEAAKKASEKAPS